MGVVREMGKRLPEALFSSSESLLYGVWEKFCGLFCDFS